MVEIVNGTAEVSQVVESRFRKTLQPLMPYQITAQQQRKNGYDIYPAHQLGGGQIQHGYPGLARWMAKHSCVIVDGYSGVLWDDVQWCLQEAFSQAGINAHFINVASFYKPADEIADMVAPFLGESESVWGRKTSLTLSDFFKPQSLQHIRPSAGYDCTIIMGTGAALTALEAPVVYLEVPKNEIQYRSRAGSISNLGIAEPGEPAHMYKQFYFVDWVVLNRHKENILNNIVVHADVQWKSDINWMLATTLESALQKMATGVLRVRPWFEPGAWGGHWMEQHINGLNREEINYAWSFELIVPENGLLLESDGYLLEIPFDLLMWRFAREITGRQHSFFGTEFPIRFDFLDTWEGGNLSIQCHPSLAYIREQFNEQITQDETYYILDCKPGAKVYLGFQDNIDENEFRSALENSKVNETPIEIEKYVQSHEAAKHELFLIPNGTIHSAGADNLVLEISATPYIFTFKMYDWLRLDLNGEPRAINIEHAYRNLHFDRKGEKVKQELIAHPVLLEQQDGFTIWHLPTHAQHFYDVHRLEFDKTIAVTTDDSCNVLMLVEGTSVTVQTGNTEQTFQYAETFVIAAAAGRYTLTNNGTTRARVVKAFIKEHINFLK